MVLTDVKLKKASNGSDYVLVTFTSKEGTIYNKPYFCNELVALYQEKENSKKQNKKKGK